MEIVSGRTPGEILVKTGDTTILSIFVHHVLLLSPDKESYVVRMTPFDEEVFMKFDRSQLEQAYNACLKDVDSLTFDGDIVACSHICLANVVRRALVNLIEVTAITEVKINVNTSSVPSELIAHRIGLIPITDDRTTDTKLPIQGHMKTTMRPRTRHLVFEDPLVRPSYDFSFMDSADELALSFKCERGIGVTHKKFAACASGSYRPEIAMVGANERIRKVLEIHGLTLDVNTGKIKEEFRREFVEDIIEGDVEWILSGEVKVQIVPIGQFSVERTRAELIGSLRRNINSTFGSLKAFCRTEQ
jgi:hypothetical protein